MSNQRKTSEELQLLRDAALEAYLSREDFRYDMNADALYQQYKDRYQEMGRNAMKDTMGQAAALTGGYGSSYAQKVGQQAYQGYLQQLGDVVPELYQLAYNRYQAKGDQLYKTYQSWAQQEQDAAQWEWKQQEAAKEEAANKEQSAEKYEVRPDYYALLNSYQGKGSRLAQNDPTIDVEYDNQNVSTGNIIAMQRLLGRKETGMWTLEDRSAAGGLKADAALAAYQQGKLHNYRQVDQRSAGVTPDQIKVMERMLDTEENGIWDDEDWEAAGGLSAFSAWQKSLRGQLQMRR